MKKRLSMKQAFALASQPKAETLTVTIEGKTITVPRSAYVKAKHKQLTEFGYEGLTEAEVDAQVTVLLEGKTFGTGLTVIGGFMQSEVKPPSPQSKS